MTTPTQPGPYFFADAIGAPEVRLQVVQEGDELIARFPAEEEDPACEMPVADMAGDWRPAA